MPNINQLPKAILFDMDDTIIADDAFTQRAWQTTCNRFANLVGGIKSEQLYAVIKETSGSYWSDPEQHRKGRLNLIQARREVVSLAFLRLGLHAHQVAVELADSYSAEKERLIAPLPGAIEILHTLRTKGVRLALLTNGGTDAQRRKIDRFGLAPFFDHILIEGEFGVGKPDERIFQSALEKLQVVAGQTWMVGDDLDRDIAGAQKLGIYSIWLNWKGIELSSSAMVRPERVIFRLSQLLN